MDRLPELSPQLLVKNLPSTQYAIFTFEGEEISSDWEKILEDWMKASGYQSSGTYNFQYYDERFKGLDRISESVLDVYIPIKKNNDLMCDQVAPIFQAIEFIESHLQEDITVAQIADAAGYSLFHFMRKFNQMVHHTPYDYLIRRRLTEAAKALIHSDQTDY